MANAVGTTSEYASWEDVAAAVDDACMNGDGRAGPYGLEYFFQKHGLVVIYHDRPQAGAELEVLESALATIRHVADRLRPYDHEMETTVITLDSEARRLRDAIAKVGGSDLLREERR